MYLSWFNHLWGKNEIHTVVFDFDDTLVDSINIQVKAWVYSIKHFIKIDEITKLDLDNSISQTLNNSEKLISVIKKIFIQEQHSPVRFTMKLLLNNSGQRIYLFYREPADWRFNKR